VNLIIMGRELMEPVAIKISAADRAVLKFIHDQEPFGVRDDGRFGDLPEPKP
jgi:hypothetical protein